MGVRPEHIHDTRQRPSFGRGPLRRFAVYAGIATGVAVNTVRMMRNKRPPKMV
jgi:hypothetical protein